MHNKLKLYTIITLELAIIIFLSFSFNILNQPNHFNMINLLLMTSTIMLFIYFILICKDYILKKQFTMSIFINQAFNLCFIMYMFILEHLLLISFLFISLVYMIWIKYKTKNKSKEVIDAILFVLYLITFLLFSYINDQGLIFTHIFSWFKDKHEYLFIPLLFSYLLSLNKEELDKIYNNQTLLEEKKLSNLKIALFNIVMTYFEIQLIFIM